ncbi:MAG: aldo/keto reductase [Gammaproteobacteria bacterium]|nr:aldo/keto reductase [Gammaproteobacteria bacterium]MDE0442267.1 aldo/keto reductase [Gammaproteobacteria bacterium]
MLRRPLGNTGIEVSPLGLGTVKFGRNTAVDYPRPYEIPSDGCIADLLATAQHHGINLLDTAPAYGTSETRIGEAIEGRRDDWVVCTKAGETFDGTESHFDFSEDAILRSVEKSLVRLRTDTVDILLLHSDGRSVDLIESAGAFRALSRLRREAIVRAVGFSGKSAADAEGAMSRCDVLMCTINAGYRDEVGIARKAADLGAGVLVKKTLARGFQGDAETIAETACLDGVTSVVVGMIDANHLAANAAAIRRTCDPRTDLAPRSHTRASRSVRTTR